MVSLRAALDQAKAASEPLDPDSETAHVVYHDVFQVVPCLTDLLRFDEHAQAASDCYDIYVDVADSPKELVLALEQQVKSGLNVDDNDDNHAQSIRVRLVLVRALTSALVRVKTKAFDKFLTSAVEAIDPLLQYGELEPIQQDELARVLFDFVTFVCLKILNAADETREKCEEMMIRLFLKLSLLLFERVALSFTDSLSSMAHASYPRLTSRRSTSTSTSTSEPEDLSLWKSLDGAIKLTGTARHLKLATLLSDSDYDVAFGAMTVLATRELLGSGFGGRSVKLPFGYIRLALDVGTPIPASVVGLFWLWGSISPLCSRSVSHDGSTSDVVEVLAAFCATCPDEVQRSIAYRILVLVIESAKPPMQIGLLEQLVSECPFESVTIASRSILREVALKAFETRKNDSPLISPLFLRTFGPALLTIALEAQEEGGQKESELDRRLITENANVLLLFIARDEKNETGVRSPEVLRRVRSDFVDRIHRVLDETKAKTDEVESDMIRLAIEPLERKIASLLP